MGTCVTARPPGLTPDVSAVPACKPSDPLPDLQWETIATACPYRVLKAADVQCVAVVNCAVANTLDAESRLACSSKGTPKSSMEVQSQALLWRAADERNRAASNALELFYLLSEAECNRDLIGRSNIRISALLDEIRNLQSQGIRVEKGPPELYRQQFDLLDREAQLQLALRQLNGRLRSLMGLTPEDTSRIWPDADLKVIVEPIDPAAAVAQGLPHRPDLCVLRTLIQSPDDSSLEAARWVLGSVTGTPPVSVAGGCVLGRSSSSGESGTRSSQLSDLLANRERAAVEEIRTAVSTVEVRFRQIAVAKCRAERSREELDFMRLRRERPNATVTSLDVGGAELQWLDAQRELVHEVVALRIAQAKLKEAQGLLVAECCPCQSY